MATEHSAVDPLHDTPGVANFLKPDRRGARAPSPRTIERWRTSGKGPDFIKIGRRVLYRESAIRRWLNQQTRSHTSQTNDERPARTQAR